MAVTMPVGAGRPNRRFGIFLAIACSWVALAGTSPAQELDEPSRGAFTPQYGIEVSARSLYVFRGVAYSQGPVSQTSVWLEMGNFSAYAFGNLLLRNEAYNRRLSEIDFGVAYDFEHGNWTLEPAYDRYTYRVRGDFESPPTGEASLAVAYDALAVRIATKQLVDVGAAAGAYYGETGMTWERELGRRLALSADCTVGWASARYHRYYLGVSTAGLSHLDVGIGVSFNPSQKFYLGFELELTSLPARALRDVVDRPDLPRFAVILGFRS